ncbi:hypothetical protein [Mucilaginibacter sp. UR6-11]|uniref:hypothetical protein n=1 Tax=Mucilaginibacter sp. UR6-11 TaxID=1435644 RepID=UPI001E3E2AD3|nr:hypothetical protein [Mucilaginibacter sp. UR6-11]MCC8425193.1 hypothetical protein [Mucilaginibacter sp. UR6-11]
MKITNTSLIALAIFQLLLISSSYAQTNTLKPAPANVTIDGSLKEWGDSLSYYNPETQLNYTLANDKDNLYLVLKTNDPIQQHGILTWGITLGIDTRGHKKSTYSVTFPVQEQGFGNDDATDDPKLAISFSKLKRIKADGFKDVENDIFTLQNTYGFRVAMDYDKRGFLVYEEVIPLALFHADELKKNEWAFDIKINAPQLAADKPTDDAGKNENMGSRGGEGGGHRGGGGRGGAGGGRGGMGGGRGGQYSGNAGHHDSAAKPVDFWAKYTLAKTQ